MRKILAAVFLTLLCFDAEAGSKLPFTRGTSIAPIWQWNFTTGVVPSSFTTSGGANGTAFNSSGNLVSATAPRFDYDPIALTPRGILYEESRINIVLWNRDLTNAAWTKSNVTAALDQTGLDGSSNTASSITASAGNGTVLQSVTTTSALRLQSAWIKRITGSGTLNMTTDNGSTWTALTSSNCFQIGSTGAVGVAINSSTWVRCQIPTQTLANPTMGFQIVTNGDAFAVDGVQSEIPSGTFVSTTSTILTTSAAVTRSADNIAGTTAGSRIGSYAGTIAIKWQGESGTQNANATVLEGDSTSGVTIEHFGAVASLISRAGTTRQTFGASTTVGAGVAEATISWGPDITLASVNGTAQANSSSPVQVPWSSAFHLGARGGTSLFYNGWILGMAVYQFKLPQNVQNSLCTNKRF